MKFLRDGINFIKQIVQKKSAIYELAKREFQAQNKDTYLGIIWGYIQPLMYILLLVLVFNIGLRKNPGRDIPFVVYLISGMIVWQFFSITFGGITQIVKMNSFLIKKGNFNLALLHVASILSSLIPHLVLLGVTVIICWFHGFPPTIYDIQLIYYLIALFLLLLALGWITSSTSLFVQDVANIVGIICQFGFWFTPIIWNISTIPEKYQWLVKMNPMCYIVTGYRDSLIYKIPFWSKPYETLYYWIFTIVILLLGRIIFKKLKPHFGEVI